MMEKMSNSLATMFSKEMAGNDVKMIVDGLVHPKVIEQLENQKTSKEQVENIVKSMNQFVSASRTHLNFEFHEKLEDYYVTIVDSETNDVVKELPSKKLLDMYASMLEFMGILVDKKI